MSRRFNRPHRDANQAAIVKALEACGCSVLDLSPLGKGCPDLAVCGGPLDRVWLVEVKNSANWRGKRGTADAHQGAWMARWPEPSIVLMTEVSAVAWLAGQRQPGPTEGASLGHSGPTLRDVALGDPAVTR